MLERLLSPATETLTSKDAVTNKKWSVKRDATVRLGPRAFSSEADRSELLTVRPL